jgi:hypothetical protein
MKKEAWVRDSECHRQGIEAAAQHHISDKNHMGNWESALAEI